MGTADEQNETTQPRGWDGMAEENKVELPALKHLRHFAVCDGNHDVIATMTKDMSSCGEKFVISSDGEYRRAVHQKFSCSKLT